MPRRPGWQARASAPAPALAARAASDRPSTGSAVRTPRSCRCRSGPGPAGRHLPAESESSPPGWELRPRSRLISRRGQRSRKGRGRRSARLRLQGGSSWGRAAYQPEDVEIPEKDLWEDMLARRPTNEAGDVGDTMKRMLITALASGLLACGTAHAQTSEAELDALTARVEKL